MNFLLAPARGAALGLLTLAAVSPAAREAPEFREIPNFHQVNAGLYRGARPKNGGLKKLAALGIRTVIDLLPESDLGDAEADAAKAAGIRYINVPLSNIKRPALADVEKVLALINDPANQPVFVHCKRGADRTGTIIAAYRISRDGWSADEAIGEAKLYAMAWWQRAMRDFIRDYAAMQGAASPPKDR